MKIIVVGGTGTIGQAVVKELEARHEVIVAAQNSGDVRVDMTDEESIVQMYQEVGRIDAVIVTAGKVHFGDFSEMTYADYDIGVRGKLMGQVNIVLAGRDYINDQGSFTLTSGILNRDPIRFGSSASMANGALEGFVKGVALEMPRGVRINCISPTVIQESMENYAPYFRGFEPVSAARAALAYSKSVEGLQTGQVYCVG